MTTASCHIVIIGLAEGVERPPIAEVLGELDVDPRPGPRWRSFGSRLLTVWSDELRDERVAGLRQLEGVSRVVHLRGAQRLYSHWPSATPVVAAPAAERPPRLQVPLAAGVAVGGASLVIAGPCTVESEDQVLETAERVAAAGARALRGGVFKPRTSPYSFGGLGEAGLHYLARARERTGLPVVTEALEPSQLDLVAQYADAVQIGARSMYRSSLLFAAGAHPMGLPVLLKRSFGATVDDLLSAAEYVLLGRIAAGHDAPGLMLCERGIRTFTEKDAFTLDLGALPTLARRCPLPIIVDPSHAARRREIVPALARAALAAHADGLLIEVHPKPSAAWCDGRQGLSLDTFDRLMAELGGG